MEIATFVVNVKVVCLVTMVILVKGSMTENTCPPNQEALYNNGTIEKCCDTCKPGTGAAVKCSSENNTVCESCISGQTFSNVTSYNGTCKACATCGNNTHFVIHPCNVTFNTVCACPSGSYYDAALDECRFCDLCPAGWGTERNCTKSQNTICTQCVHNNTYSDTLDFRSGCKPCKQCTEAEVMLQACGVTEDTICFSTTAGKRKPSYNYSSPTVYKQNEDDDGDIIPVYCAALGLVVVGLLGYVIFKHWSRLRAKRRHKTPCTHDDVEYSKASGADSGVFVENDSPKNYTYCLASRVRDLPHGKRRELEKVLSSPVSDGWKELARELGYSSRRLTQFESRGKSENSCFKHMLHDWERHNQASVSQLIQSLRNIGRDDAAKILYFDSTEGRTQALAMAKHSEMV